MDDSKDLYASLTSSNSISNFKTFSTLFYKSFSIYYLSNSKTSLCSSNFSLTILEVISSILGVPFSNYVFNSSFNSYKLFVKSFYIFSPTIIFSFNQFCVFTTSFKSLEVNIAPELMFLNSSSDTNITS